MNIFLVKAFLLLFFSSFAKIHSSTENLSHLSIYILQQTVEKKNEIVRIE